MRLYLVRHGQAHPEDADPERHLTPDGKAAVRKVADHLKPADLVIPATWHSGKPRARQTAELLAESLSLTTGIHAHDDLGPKDPVQPVRRQIEADEADLMIVGHLPFLGHLAGLLLTGDESADVVAFDAGAVCCLARDDEGNWKISWLLGPGQLP